MTETEIFKAIESRYGSGTLMAFADLIESENMNTYDSYQEAKIANPDSDIFGLYDRFTTENSEVTPKVSCNPADYCMTVEQFLKANGELPDGALILHHDGSYNILIDNYMKDICSHDSDSFVIEVPVLEQPKQEVEWEVLHGDSWIPCIRLGKDIYGNYAYQLSDGEFKGEFNGTPNLSSFRKPKSERELVIEQACKLIPTTAEEDIKIIGKLYDLGMLKPIKEQGVRYE